MLKASLYGTSQTHLMVRTGLNYSNFINYLSELLDEELLERTFTSNNKVLYKTTKEGREVVKALEEARKRVEL
jgi:predicted transcriptional regulator